jgi:hypothetical protein
MLSIMSLPKRIKAFLNRLQLYLERPALDAFGSGARKAFFGAGAPSSAPEIGDFVDYTMFAHRDEDGRSLIDLFVADHGSALLPEERDVLTGFRRSVYGMFSVEATRPGAGLTLRRCGDDARFEVVEVDASRSLKPGMGVIARLVPYRGSHEISGALRAMTPEVTRGCDRLLRENAGAAEAVFSPLAMRKLLRRVASRRAAADEQLEAESHAAAAFAAVRFPLSVEETQRRFQTEASALDLLRKLPDLGIDDPEERDALLLALTHLWNHTPRTDLGGRSPAQARAESAESAGESEDLEPEDNRSSRFSRRRAPHSHASHTHDCQSHDCQGHEFRDHDFLEDDADDDGDDDVSFDPDDDSAGDITPLVREEPKIGRNDPCPCGSGKKYKRCCEPERRV